MKIRIKGNTIRFRLTKSEVHQISTTGYVEEQIPFITKNLMYSVSLSESHKNLAATFEDDKIQLFLPETLGKNWYEDNIVGFEHIQELPNGKTLSLLIEKDFACLDNRLEDQADNYPNPKAIQS